MTNSARLARASGHYKVIKRRSRYRTTCAMGVSMLYPGDHCTHTVTNVDFLTALRRQCTLLNTRVCQRRQAALHIRYAIMTLVCPRKLTQGAPRQNFWMGQICGTSLYLIPPCLPFSSLSLEVGPLNTAKLSQRGQGQSPSGKEIWCILAFKSDIKWHQFLPFFPTTDYMQCAFLQLFFFVFLQLNYCSDSECSILKELI